MRLGPQSGLLLINETESMKKFRTNVFGIERLEIRHQFQIIRENEIKMVPIPAAIMKVMGHTDLR